jgi:MerR family transcriptional regulator, light-induced transcriptional regulator
VAPRAAAPHPSQVSTRAIDTPISGDDSPDDAGENDSTPAFDAALVADGPRLTVAAVAHRLGVAPATLRTWARRYGLGPSDHSAGAHRRYTAEDVGRLQAMRRLTLEGVPPAEAARVVLTTPFVPEAPLAGPLPDREGSLRRRGGPGGRVLALPGADGVVRGLGRAAMALDARTVTRTLRAEVDVHGVLHTWEHVLRPVLVAVGERWATTGQGVEVEHLLSDCVATVLREVADRAEEQPGRRPVLLSCAPEENHTLPLHALAAALGERGIAARSLGPALPASAIEAAVRRTGPALLFVWSQLPGTADPTVLAGLPVTRPPTSVVVGGPGWRADRLPHRVTVATGLPQAVELVERAVGV